MNSSEILKLLTSFALQNESLDRLNMHLQRFNPLKVLRLDHYEIRHSNVLGWLIDPVGNHNLHDEVFKKLLLSILLHPDNENKPRPPVLSESFIYLNHFMDLEVHREWNISKKHTEDISSSRLIDLVLVSHQYKIAIIIENKIYAKESNNQLNDYYKMVELAYPSYQVLPIFLTRFGESPSDDRYLVFNYIELASLLKRLLLIHEEAISQRVSEFIQDYIYILDELTDSSNHILELCEQLYLEHKNAVELILSIDLRALDPQDSQSKSIYELVRMFKDVARYIKEKGAIDYFKAATRLFAQEHPELTFSGNMGSSAMWFYPNEYRLIPGLEQLTHKNYLRFCPYPIPYIFGFKGDNLELKIEIGQCKDEFSSHKMKFAELLDKRLGRTKTRSLNAVPTVIQTDKRTTELKVEERTNQYAILKSMNEVYDQMKDHYEILWSCIQEFDFTT